MLYQRKPPHQPALISLLSTTHGPSNILTQHPQTTACPVSSLWDSSLTFISLTSPTHSQELRQGLHLPENLQVSILKHPIKTSALSLSFPITLYIPFIAMRLIVLPFTRS